ncbi:hypothetical protein FQN54_000094 [Arachnomyces sp. PD_36]|nr:hypothetical protein FQN54_000094 [Arachnomyces sp. PD_36]
MALPKKDTALPQSILVRQMATDSEQPIRRTCSPFGPEMTEQLRNETVPSIYKKMRETAMTFRKIANTIAKTVIKEMTEEMAKRITKKMVEDVTWQMIEETEKMPEKAIEKMIEHVANQITIEMATEIVDDLTIEMAGR